jgi:hypothetical protein
MYYHLDVHLLKYNRPYLHLINHPTTWKKEISACLSLLSPPLVQVLSMHGLPATALGQLVQSAQRRLGSPTP